jgi:hypothetical protein
MSMKVKGSSEIGVRSFVYESPRLILSLLFYFPAASTLASIALRKGTLNRAQASMTRCKSARTPELCESVGES